MPQHVLVGPGDSVQLSHRASIAAAIFWSCLDSAGATLWISKNILGKDAAGSPLQSLRVYSLDNQYQSLSIPRGV